MANFIFNWATAALAAATLDLSTGNYYAHLVTTVPALGHSTVADLVIPTISSYASTPLTGLSYNSTRWTFDSFSFPKYSFVSAPTGVVICKRTGANPATTDGIVCYSDFNNSIGQGISLSVGAYVVNLQFGSNGAINFSYRYQYNSGVFANTEAIPKGLIYLIGSRNNTQVFADPTPSKLTIIKSVSFGGVATDRSTAYVSLSTGTTDLAIDFGTTSVKPGKFGVHNIANNTSTTQYTVYGSNDVANNFPTNWNNLSFYTNLGTVSLTNSGVGFVGLIPCITSNYWRYLLVRSIAPNSIGFAEVELYESTALSTTVNFL